MQFSSRTRDLITFFSGLLLPEAVAPEQDLHCSSESLEDRCPQRQGQFQVR